MSNFEYQNFNMPVATFVTPAITDSIQPKGDFTMDIETELDLMTFENAPATITAIPTKVPGFQHGVPSGSYKSSIKDATHTVHPGGGHDVIKITLVVAVPPYAGHSFTKFYNLKTKKAVDFFRREMDGIGSIVTSRQELGGLCGSLVGRPVLAQIADHPSGNQVIFLKKLKAQSAPVVTNPAELWS